MICYEPECCEFKKPASSSCRCAIVPDRRAEFVEQKYGARVATICETDDGLLEIQDMRDGTYTLTVHSRVGETDRFEDMSIRLKPEHFAMLGSVVR